MLSVFIYLFSFVSYLELTEFYDSGGGDKMCHEDEETEGKSELFPND